MGRPLSPYYNLASAWGLAVPLSGPFGAPECLGVWFEVDVGSKLAGFRWYTDGRSPDFALFQLWEATGAPIAQSVISAKEAARVPAGPGWRTVWCHPRTELLAATPYLVSASVAVFAANFGALASAPIVNGHITVLQNGTTPNPANAVYDALTDTGGRYPFLNPPADATAGNWYAIDVFLEV